MDTRIRLRVLGISYAQLKNAAYMLILRQVNGPYNIHMWIGEAEAHSIAIAMEGIHPPRPLTHDLFVSFVHAFGVKLRDVFIYKVDDDIYSSELTFTDGERTVKIDSRTSDGIAIAMRTGAPIYTTRAILEEKGFLLDISHNGSTEQNLSDSEPDDEEDNDDSMEPDSADSESEVINEYTDFSTSFIPKLENYAIEELEKTLQKLIEAERYEEAARVNEILQRKKNSRAKD